MIPRRSRDLRQLAGTWFVSLIRLAAEDTLVCGGQEGIFTLHNAAQSANMYQSRSPGCYPGRGS
jgi:hypothetical protein